MKNVAIQTVERIISLPIVKERLKACAEKSSEKIRVKFTFKLGVDGSSVMLKVTFSHFN